MMEEEGKAAESEPVAEVGPGVACGLSLSPTKRVACLLACWERESQSHPDWTFLGGKGTAANANVLLIFWGNAKRNARRCSRCDWIEAWQSVSVGGERGPSGVKSSNNLAPHSSHASSRGAQSARRRGRGRGRGRKLEDRLRALEGLGHREGGNPTILENGGLNSGRAVYCAHTHTHTHTQTHTPPPSQAPTEIEACDCLRSLQPIHFIQMCVRDDCGPSPI